MAETLLRDASVVGRGCGRAGETAAAASFIDVKVTPATDLGGGFGPRVGRGGCAGPGPAARVFAASVTGRTSVGVPGWTFGRRNYFGPCRELLCAALQFAAVGDDDVGQRSVFRVNRYFGNPFEDFRAGYDLCEDSMFGVEMRARSKGDEKPGR